ncbi:phosphatase PAP2 family protein [Iodobacter sp.]|uniref:acid phosphatase n=1 Tax=Iodobacter sp. TaxID=1915058 RepID=UPI0025D2C303|nr:phosphatase PAP2 family protein [Iodobacter sp.]
MNRILSSLLLALLIPCTPAWAEEAKPFVSSTDVDLTHYLPAPPANDSAQTKLEIAEVLAFQAKRTPETAAAAAADAAENIWRFNEVMGPKFKAEKLPKFAAFFERVVETEGAVVDSAKNYWKRPRPHMLNSEIQPVVKRSSSGSWPSGHATVGYLMATVLAEMVPEKRSALFTRAAEYAENRIVAGIHYRSDIQMGRVAAALIAQKILSRDDFNAEFAPAKAELRSVLGL